MVASDLDHRVRLRAFAFLGEMTALHGPVLPRTLLLEGFEFEGRQVALMSHQQGIWKPAILPEIPLSIMTAPVVAGKERPYDDEIGPNGILSYKYCGPDPFHRDNVGLRRAIATRTPLVYLLGMVKGRYRPLWPAHVIGDDPHRLTFTVAIEGEVGILPGMLEEEIGETTRAYATRLTVQRLHQEEFRERVLRAYREQCAVCRLHHPELLDAAHILGDKHPRGAPVVPNGLSLCRLHHAAFDRNILGVRPDLIVELREDILREEDGPMLVHGLQGFQGRQIHVPRNRIERPNPENLAERYELFRKAS